jgi:DcuC family C4-dicarboxylate transporter
LSLISVIVVYFVNTIGDRKVEKEVYEVIEKKGVKAPLIYAVLPVLPLILLIVFSKLFQPFGRPVVLDTTTAMFISFAVAFVFEAIRKRKLKELFDSVKVYFSGMANIFKTVVTLIVAADIFAQGLIALGFLDSLVEGSNRLGMGVAGIGGLLVALIFFTSILMGSGNASFFAFGPLVPGIASKFGVSPVQLILPMNMAASIGRTASPVSGVLIAVSELAGISSFDLAKRNALPMAVIVVSLFIIHFFF